MAKINLVEKNGSEDKSGVVEINASFNAYYELTESALTLEVDMVLSNDTVGATGSATVKGNYTLDMVTHALEYAALRAMDRYIVIDLNDPSSDNGASTAKVSDNVQIAAHKLSYTRHFRSAAANILHNLGED